jgi:hypothetical protein
MTTNSLYRDILKKAWATTFNNRIFWFFGLFSAPLLCGVYEVLKYTQLFSEENVLLKWGNVLNTGALSLFTIKELSSSPLALFIYFSIMAILGLIFLFLIWISVVSQGSLIDAIDESKTKEIANPQLSKFIAKGIENFWPVFKINATVIIFSHILLLLASISALAIYLSASSKQVAPNFIYLLFVILFIPLTLIFSFIGKYATNFVVIKKEHFWSALKNSYNLFKENWLITLEMGFLLLFISFAFLIMFSSLGFFIFIPFWLISYILASLGAVIVLKAIILIGILTALLLTVFATAILSTFQYACWTLLFKQLISKEKSIAKLHRVFKY